MNDVPPGGSKWYGVKSLRTHPVQRNGDKVGRVVPARHEEASQAENPADRPEGLADGDWLVQAPAEHAVHQDEVEIVLGKAVAHVGRALHDVAGGAVAASVDIMVNGPKLAALSAHFGLATPT
jgi:hypothetical protein